ncbi:MAG: DUF4038 domain-containing protein, partial [Syntrophobacteraceae bacterium]|nr:DUF4038 domain-containing protein [Syntrophobacteraceae bacterium]
FNVIQAVVLAESDGLNTPNPYGERPLNDHDPLQPNARYFDHVDRVIRLAGDKGLFVGLLPTWGDKVELLAHGKGPIIFNPDKGDIEVFDGEGNPAAEVAVDELNPIYGLKKAHNLTVLSTKTNPYCVWVYTPAGWRKVCY